MHISRVAHPPWSLGEQVRFEACGSCVEVIITRLRPRRRTIQSRAACHTTYNQQYVNTITTLLEHTAATLAGTYVGLRFGLLPVFGQVAVDRGRQRELGRRGHLVAADPRVRKHLLHAVSLLRVKHQQMPHQVLGAGADGAPALVVKGELARLDVGDHLVVRALALGVERVVPAQPVDTNTSVSEPSSRP